MSSFIIKWFSFTLQSMVSYMRESFNCIRVIQINTIIVYIFGMCNTLLKHVILERLFTLLRNSITRNPLEALAFAITMPPVMSSIASKSFSTACFNSTISFSAVPTEGFKSCGNYENRKQMYIFHYICLRYEHKTWLDLRVITF